MGPIGEHVLEFTAILPTGEEITCTPKTECGFVLRDDQRTWDAGHIHIHHAPDETHPFRTFICGRVACAESQPTL